MSNFPIIIQQLCGFFWGIPDFQTHPYIDIPREPEERRWWIPLGTAWMLRGWQAASPILIQNHSTVGAPPWFNWGLNNVGPSSYKLVYNPPSNYGYSYNYHKPKGEIVVMFTNWTLSTGGPTLNHCSIDGDAVGCNGMQWPMWSAETANQPHQWYPMRGSPLWGSGTMFDDLVVV